MLCLCVVTAALCDTTSLQACELHSRETAPLFSWMPALVGFMCGPFPYQRELKELENSLDPTTGKALLAEHTHFEDQEVDWLQREFFDLRKQDAALQKVALPKRLSRTQPAVVPVSPDSYITPLKKNHVDGPHHHHHHPYYYASSSAAAAAAGALGTSETAAVSGPDLTIDAILDLARLSDRSCAVHDGLEAVLAVTGRSDRQEPPCGSPSLAKVFAPVVSTELLHCLFSSVDVTGPKPHASSKQATTPLVEVNLLKRQMSHGSKTSLKMNGLQQFVETLSVICRGTTEEKVRLCFRAFDQDQDGYLNLEELATMLDLVLVEGTPAWQRLARYQSCEKGKGTRGVVLPRVLRESLLCLALELLHQVEEGGGRTSTACSPPPPNALGDDAAAAHLPPRENEREGAASDVACIFARDKSRVAAIFECDDVDPSVRRAQALEWIRNVDAAAHSTDDASSSSNGNSNSTSVWKMNLTSFASLFNSRRPDLFYFVQDIKAIACTELPIKPRHPTEEATILRYLWQQFQLPDTTMEGHKRHPSDLPHGLEVPSGRSAAVVMADADETAFDALSRPLGKITSNFGLRSRVFKGIFPHMTAPPSEAAAGPSSEAFFGEDAAASSRNGRRGGGRGSSAVSGWYLVPMAWWTSWLRYTHFEQTLVRKQYSSFYGANDGNEEAPPPPPPPQAVVEAWKVEGPFPDKVEVGCVSPVTGSSDGDVGEGNVNGKVAAVFEHPGPIPTLSLFCNDNAQNKLRIGLKRGKDFEVVCPEVWRALFSWHGCKGPPVFMVLRSVPEASTSLLPEDRTTDKGRNNDEKERGNVAASSSAYELSMSQHVAYKMNSAHDVSILQEDEHDAENDGPGTNAEDGGDPEDDVLEISTIQVAKSGAESASLLASSSAFCRAFTLFCFHSSPFVELLVNLLSQILSLNQNSCRDQNNT